MSCGTCGYENPQSNAFCGRCGAQLELTCARCGHSNPPANGFCGQCGQPLKARDAAGPEPLSANPAETGERRQLTVLFCDLVGSTDLAARLDAEEYSEALHAYHTCADAVITRYGGHVAQHLGDGLLVYFGWPQTYDDAAERAARAGLGLVEATATVEAGGAPLAARVGLHTGSVVVSTVGGSGHHEILALGDTPNVAARVQGAAQPNTVVLSAATLRLVSGLFIVEELGAHTLKGVPRPVDLYRVIQPSGVRGRLAASAARGLTPFVGRQQERALLHSRFEQAADGEGQMVLLAGEAGIGKSRLAQQLRAEIADAPHTWLETRSSPYSANTPFSIVAELFSDRPTWEDGSSETRAQGLAKALRRAGLDPQVALPLVAPLLDIPVPEDCPPLRASPEVIRKRLLATLAAWLFAIARLQPLVLLVEDLHWADPSSVELLTLLAEQGATAPVLMLCTARPHFQAPWPPRAHHTQLSLNRLPKRYVRDIVSGVAARSALLAEVVEAVVARTDGVPLFVEELTKTVVETGSNALREIPSTLADSLMARLDRLGPEARDVAQVGAVCGHEFDFALLRAVHPLPDAELEEVLRKLTDAELVYVRGLPPEATYTFRHALVQDTAYGSLLKSRQRMLHGRVANALRERFPDVGESRPELLAYHYNAAGQFEAAMASWQRAGEQALERSAYTEAAVHLRQALKALAALPEGPARDQQEFTLQLALGNALYVSKSPTCPETVAAVERAVEVAKRLPSPEQVIFVLFALTLTKLYREGPAEARALGEQVAALEASTVDVSQAMSRGLRGVLLYSAGEFEAAANELTAFLAEYDSSTERVLPFDPALSAYAYRARAWWQLGAVNRACAEMRDAIERANAKRTPVRWTLLIQAAEFYTLLRAPAEARACVDEILKPCDEAPSDVIEGFARTILGWALAEEGDPVEGIAAARAGIAMLLPTGYRLRVEYSHGLLAESLLHSGDLEGARGALAEGEQLCPSAHAHHLLTLLLGAELLVAEETPAAEIEAAYTAALSHMRERRAKSFELRTATSYARWLRDMGRGDEGRAVLAPVYASFTEGFDTRDLCEARDLLTELEEGEAPAAAAGA